ncbi:hypothetical protein BJF85_23575 [Saccharomonospora sp. CUA-673]|uniref:ABC transporter family substrate-binding protein n=1 Tax=Saccharomonospora sp. CUA-673 TaxID=1904969 RepID=UPI000960A236|nr:ABC transporter family substrate-binding protein [Saccharomonospora sp. CUA-673]OLT42061.1 hypothetical protein BJF85_23575 [Saccharomonospora sp. CUA-673]
MRAIRGGRRGRGAAAPAVALVATLAAGCTNMPPPPIVSSQAAPTSQPVVEQQAQVAVGVDTISGGYNPHNVADQSTTTSALASMLLPSVFRPGEDGRPELDERLMVSAEVVAHDPFTVSYEIRPDASWSDGAPIAVEDFVYLHEAMRSQPGVVGAAGYRLISDISPAEGGKRVDVQFSEPYPGWRTLFDHLLPAHLLKDAPGGWQNALSDSFPAYGGPFAITTVDHARGEMVLERNERYWEQPAAVDKLVLRRTDPTGLVGALRTGTDQLTVVRTDAGGMERLRELGDALELSEQPRPYVVSTLLRPVGELADDDVREAVGAMVDRDALIAAGADGGPSASHRAAAHVRAPSDEDYRPTIPEAAPRHPQPRKAERLLREAGYELEAGTWTRDGRPLSLALAAPGDREPYASVAEELSRQLVESGVEIRDVEPENPRELFNHYLAPGANGEDNGAMPVDIAVVPQPVSTDPASTLASSFGCAPAGNTAAGTAADDDTDGNDTDGNDEREAGGASGADQESEGRPETGDDGPAWPGNANPEGDADAGGTDESSESTEDAESTEGNDGDGGNDDPESNDSTSDNNDSTSGELRSANVAGYCDPELQSHIDDALTGATPLGDTLATVEPSLWHAGVTIPLFQPVDTVAVSRGVDGVRSSDSLTEPFDSAVDWDRRTG